MHEILDQPMPVYTGANGLTGLWGWMECSPTLDPYDSKATFEEQTRNRELWAAIAQDEIFEKILTHTPPFSAILLNSFSSAFNDLRNRISEIEQLSECWTYVDFVSCYTKILSDSFTLAQSVLDDLFEHANALTTIDSMGLELSAEEQSFIKNLRAMKGGECQPE
jgi:hypothetical protein